MSAVNRLGGPEFVTLTWVLVHFLWQGALVACLLAATVWLLRIRRAPARYACSLTAMIVMAGCPVVTYLVIGGPLPGLIVASGSPQAAIDLSALSEARPPAYPDALQAVQPYLLLLWLTGVGVLSLRLGLGLIGVVRLRRGVWPLPLSLAARVERLGESLRIEALPRVFLSRRVREALVVGLVRPMVLLPAAWASEMPLPVLEAIIAHELAHIRRFDLWVNLLQRVVETVLFYHPAVWWISRRMRHEREMCCDELAIAATGRRIEYVEALERVARERLAGVRPALAAGISGETNMKLLTRVRNVLGGQADDAGGLWPAGVLTLLLPLGLWGAAWGVLSPLPAVAVAADEERDNDDDDDDREEGKAGDRDDDDRREGDRPRSEIRKEGNRENDDDAERKPDKQLARDKEREEREGDRKEPRKEPREGQLAKKVRKDASERKEAVKKESADKLKSEGETAKKSIPKETRIEGDDPGTRKEALLKSGKYSADGYSASGKFPADSKYSAGGTYPAKEKGDFAEHRINELAALVKELSGEVHRLRSEVNELRGQKPAAGAYDKRRDESYDRGQDRKDLPDKREHAEREVAKKNQLAAEQEKRRAAKERDAAERKEREGVLRKESLR